MLEINGAVTYMKTIVKDHREEFKAHALGATMAHAFMKTGIDEQTLLREVNEKANAEMEQFENTELSVLSTYERDEIKAAELFNEMAEEHGYANRFHRIRLMIDGEIIEVKVHTINGVIASIIDYSDVVNSDTAYFKEAFEKGYLEDFYHGNHFVFTKGENTTTNEQAFVELLKKMNNENCSIDQSEGYSRLVDENKMDFISITAHKESKTLFALLKGDFKYITPKIENRTIDIVSAYMPQLDEPSKQHVVSTIESNQRLLAQGKQLATKIIEAR